MVTVEKLIKEVRAPGGYAKAFEMRKSQFLTIIDIEGQQVGGFIAFSKSDLKEKLYPLHTRTSLLTVKVSVGDVVQSKYRNKILKTVLMQSNQNRGKYPGHIQQYKFRIFVSALPLSY